MFSKRTFVGGTDVGEVEMGTGDAVDAGGAGVGEGWAGVAHAVSITTNSIGEVIRVSKVMTILLYEETYW
jgi:hypothetical protein